MNATRKILVTAAIVGALGSLAGLGVFGAFSATTQSNGEEVTAGTVAIGNNSAGQAMFNVNAADIDDVWTSCVKVTYNGSLPADVRMYMGGNVSTLAPYTNVKVEEGTASSDDAFPACTHFTPVNTLYNGVLDPNYASYATGLTASPNGVPGQWTTGSTAIYRLTVTLDPNTPNSQQAQSTGVWSVYWEAHNR